MDPRREALRETLELLDREGWSPRKRRSDQSSRTLGGYSSQSRGRIIQICCFISVLINVVLLATYHGSPATLTNTRFSLQLALVDFTAGRGDVSLLLTVDGKPVWEQRSRDGQMTINGSETKPVHIDSSCVVQLWRLIGDKPDGARELLGQYFVSASQAGAEPTDLQFHVGESLYYRWIAKVTNSRSSHLH